MQSGTIQLVERVRQRLSRPHEANPVRIFGPVQESAIVAAEEALGCTFPPSYRTFLRTFGGIALPTHLGIVHDFIGVAASEGDGDVVSRTLRARSERALGENLIVVGLGAQYQETRGAHTLHRDRQPVKLSARRQKKCRQSDHSTKDERSEPRARGQNSNGNRR